MLYCTKASQYCTMQYMYGQEIKWLLSEKYDGQKSEAFLADVAKLEAGVPLAYLIGHIPFLNCKIYLDSHPLIPRPETEFWTELAIKKIQASSATQPEVHILDLCAGSGAIGVAVANSILSALVDFAELDSSHLPTIAKNCRLNQITNERVSIFASDLFNTASGRTLPRYNYILSNPPYIDKTLDRTEQSVVENEPALALYGGKAGMDNIKKIIEEAPNHLKPDGQLWLEHEPEQSEAILNLAQDMFYVTTHKDQYDVIRFSQLVLQ
jgi:release factor glutamine methyltransferase